MSALSIRIAIARDLHDGPAWANSFRGKRQVIDQMVADGLVERVAPQGGRGRNMIALTPRGAQTYFPGAAAHAAVALGVSTSYCQRLWREIVSDMGVQAL